MGCCDSTKASVPSASNCCSTDKTKSACCPVQTAAHRLVELCKAGQFDQAENELYADSIVSIEPFCMPGHSKATVGKAALKAKGEEFHKNTTIHSCTVEGPFPQPDTNRFAVIFKMDATCKQMGRCEMNEVALYTVCPCSGKITRAEFFYAPPGGECKDKGADKSACCSTK